MPAAADCQTAAPRQDTCDPTTDAPQPGPTRPPRRLFAERRYARSMTLADCKVVLYRQIDDAWVAEVPAIGGCYALMDTREAALEELERVFRLIADEHAEQGQALPTDAAQYL